MGLNRATLRLTNLFNKQQLEINAVVDMRATFLSVTEDIALQLGFDLDNAVRQVVATPDGRQSIVPKIAPVEIGFENRTYITEALVIGNEPLLGLIPMAAMDLIVDMRKKQLIVNPLHPDHAVAAIK